jgi:hypothetical protein
MGNLTTISGFGSVQTNAERMAIAREALQAIARDHVAEFAQALERVGDLAREISLGGDSYPPGIIDIARRFQVAASSAELGAKTLLGRT